MRPCTSLCRWTFLWHCWHFWNKLSRCGNIPDIAEDIVHSTWMKSWQLVQMTEAINTTSLSANSLQKGLKCSKRHILHGNFHIPLCDSFIYMCSVSVSQIIQPLVHKNKYFGKVSSARNKPASSSSGLAKPRDCFLCSLYNASEENALEQHSVECEKH